MSVLSRAARDSLFRVCAIGALLPTLFHAVSIFSPAVASLEYSPSYPIWRHLVFIAIGASCVWLFQRRPWWLVWAYAALTIQTVKDMAARSGGSGTRVAQSTGSQSLPASPFRWGCFCSSSIDSNGDVRMRS